MDFIPCFASSFSRLPTLAELPVPPICFGVELELIIPAANYSKIDEESVAAAITQSGLECRAVGYSHEVTSYWKVVSDSSLSCSRGDEGCLRFEIVSPILLGEEGLHQLSVVIALLRELKVTVNKSCAFHLHVDARSLSFEQVRNICAQFVQYEEAFDLVMPRSRTGNTNQYARSNRAACFGQTDNQRVLETILSRRNEGGLRALLNPHGRYHKLNLHRLSKTSPTLEFRQHSGTCDFEKVRAWVLLVLNFVQNTAAAAKPPSAFKNTHKPGYKFDRLFQWVIRSPLLHDHFLQRAWGLIGAAPGVGSLDDAYLWECSCAKKFKRCADYMQHTASTSHPDPSCCTGCQG